MAVPYGCFQKFQNPPFFHHPAYKKECGFPFFFEEGATGFGFTPGDADDLIRAMENFLSLSKEGQAAMGKAAREKMEREFDRNMVIDAYMEEVDKICLASIRER